MQRFSGVRKGTLMENSRMPYLTWVNSINLELTSLKGIPGYEAVPGY